MRERIYNIVKHSAGRLRRELPRRSRFLIFFFEPFSGELQVCWPLNDIPEVTPHLFTVVHDCFTRQKECRIEDCRTASIFAETPPADIGSIVCLPLLDADGSAMGVVYLDHPEPRSVGQAEMHMLRRFVDAQQQRIPRWSSTEQLPEVAEVQTGFHPLFTLVGLTSALVICYLFLIFPREDSVPSSTRSQTTTASSPLEAATVFRATLVRRDIAGARRWMTPELQRRFTEQEMLEWLRVHKEGWELGTRDVTVSRNDSRSATVILVPNPSADDPRWKSPISLEMSNVDSGWIVRDITGQTITQK